MWPGSSSSNDVPPKYVQAKTSSYQNNLGYHVPRTDLIPMPKTCGLSNKNNAFLLNQTLNRVTNYRHFTQTAHREEPRPKSFAAPRHFPHPSVLASPLSTEAWMQKISKGVERSPNHAPEKMVGFVDGMPILVSRSRLDMYELRASCM